MAYKIRKTEHNGPKRGQGHWGLKKEAKGQSGKVRRANDKRIIREEKE